MNKYQIIYIDPPWEYGNFTKLGNARCHYKTLTFAELKQLNINKIADINCLLFLWVVSNKLDQCIDVGKFWGFKPVGVAFVWHKPNRTLCGYYTMAQTELCLVFRKGKIPQPRGSRNEKQFLSELATTHSKKPDTVRNRIYKMFPTQNKIELFARTKYDGWDTLGNEIDGDDITKLL